MSTDTRHIELVPVFPDEKHSFLALAEQHFRELNPTFTPHEDWKLHYFETIIANPDCFLRWIVVEGSRVGFVLYGLEAHRFLPRKNGMVYELYIAPDFRRLGLAREAGYVAVEHMLTMHPSKIQLEVLEGNDKAANLWESLGFRKTSTRYVLK